MGQRMHIPACSDFIHIPNVMHMKFAGLTHGLKTVHQTVFLLSFRVPATYKKERVPLVPSLFLCECFYRIFQKSVL